MKILITGGCGFIGHNVVQRLQSIGHEIMIIDNETGYNIINPDELEYIMYERKKKFEYQTNIQHYNVQDSMISMHMNMFKPDTVIHLASFPRQKIVNFNPMIGARVMCEGLLNMLQLSVKHQVSKFVYISSSMIYGNFNDDVKENAICNPMGQYAIMKYMGEKLVQDYSRRGLLNHTIIRPSAVYGELDVEDRVVSKFMLAALRDETLEVRGANERLDFTYVEDVVDGIVAASLSNNTKNKTYNVTRSKSVSLLETAELIVKIVGKGKINVIERDNSFPSRGSLNIDAAKRDFDFNPVINIDLGLTWYYHWITNSPYWKKNL
jgi:nucleoside-diphosphate-sugar epimerase